MKKKILTILCSVFMLVLLAFTASANNLGDVTGDGKINAADARLALRYASKLEELTEEQITAADVDASGKVTPADARKILRVAASLDLPFEKITLDEYLIEEGVLNVAICTDDAPFCYKEDGEIKGSDIKIIKQIADYAELELRFHEMNSEEIENYVNDGKADIGVFNNSTPSYQSSIKSLFERDLIIITTNNSDIKSLDKIKYNPSVKIGVLKNTVDEYLLRREAKNGVFNDEQIVTFTDCKRVKEAFDNNKIQAFISGEDHAYYMIFGYNNLVKCDTYSSIKRCILTSANNKDFASSINTIITNAMLENAISDYETTKANSSIIVWTDDITLAAGGTAFVEVVPDSFYGFDTLRIDNNDGMKCNIFTINGKQYVAITAPSDATNHSSHTLTIKFFHEAVNQKIKVQINNEKQKYYIHDNNSRTLDFGAFTSTAPYETTVDEENNIIVHTYLASDLYENGVTDTTKLEAYLEAIEADGYTYMGYQEIENAYSYVFANEKTQKVISYVEAVDSEGYIIAVGVGYMLPDPLFDVN